MSTYKMQIQWRTCSNLDAIREAIADGNRHDWPGLTSADQIISITWVQEMHCYTVVWRVREWLDGSESA